MEGDKGKEGWLLQSHYSAAQRALWLDPLAATRGLLPREAQLTSNQLSFSPERKDKDAKPRVCPGAGISGRRIQGITELGEPRTRT